MAVLFFDLDRFKRVNDTLGHAAGDELLKEFAGRLDGCMRDSNVVGRLGGDEFAALIEVADDLSGVSRAAERILESMEQPFELGSSPTRMTTSIGIAVFPYDPSESGTLLSRADAAMYRARSASQGGFACYRAQGALPAARNSATEVDEAKQER